MEILRTPDERFTSLPDFPFEPGQAHTTIEGAGHFLQEDRGEHLASVFDQFIAATPTHTTGGPA